MPFKIQTFSERCDGCRICEQICLTNHECSTQPRIRIFQSSEQRFEVMICNICEDHQCIKACDRGAIFIDELNGTPIVSIGLCNQCMKCVYACKNNGLFYDFESKEILACDTCNNGFFCALLCPNGALGRIKISEPIKITQNF